MKVTLRIGSLTACFLAIVPFTTGASAPTSGPDVEQPAQVRPSGLMTRITMRDGAPGQSSWRELVVLGASAHGPRSRPRPKGVRWRGYGLIALPRSETPLQMTLCSF